MNRAVYTKHVKKKSLRHNHNAHFFYFLSGDKMVNEPCPRCMKYGDWIVTDANYTTLYCMNCQTPQEARKIKQKKMRKKTND